MTKGSGLAQMARRNLARYGNGVLAYPYDGHSDTCDAAMHRRNDRRVTKLLKAAFMHDAHPTGNAARSAYVTRRL